MIIHVAVADSILDSIPADLRSDQPKQAYPTPGYFRDAQERNQRFLEDDLYQC
jgi:hypothetical protein